MTAILAVNNLGWDAGNRRILDNISFDVEQGSFVGLIGPNGSGKSSLLRCLYRVNQPCRGSVELFGQNIWQHSAKDNAKKVAVILQEHSEHLGLRVKDVVGLGLTPHKKLFTLDSPADKEKISRAIEQVDLTAFSDEPYVHLSGGEKQRVMVARAMVQDPQLLLMDEPTNHLDIHYQISVLQQVQKMGVTIFASFHDLNLAAAYCDRIITIDHGHIVSNGTPEEVLTANMIESVFKTQALVDQHPLYGKPRITYAYGESQYD
jgi:iron complex transport system ATP-binding protein